ncbi:HET-s/LopB domain protein [Xylogone sp. PMI_703]|nr:HET-s/LopB domain protein [Xylogone sp. PMI_703]
MDPGTALAVVAFADQCLKYGNKFVKRCRTYLHAQEEAAELLVSIESNWVKVETQIEIMKKIAGSLDRKLQDMQSHVLSQLEGKLKTASLTIGQMLGEKREYGSSKDSNSKNNDRNVVTGMKGISEMGVSKKMKYVFKKSTLYQILDDIEKWQARYDPTWILIMQMSIGNIDEGLHEQQQRLERQQIPIIAAAKGIRDAVRSGREGDAKDQRSIWIDDIDLNLSSISYSSAQISVLQEINEIVLIDTMVSNPTANPNQTLKEVRNLARILAEVDPFTFGLLRCRGVMKITRLNKSSCFDYKFVFNIPPQISNPKSLRSILLSGTPYPLNERLDLAKRLTSSILFLHTVQFVHKNIRPETIIVFKNEHSEIGAPFLAGFEQFRIEDGHTYLRGDNIWDHNLYRHPSRQGTHPQVNYQMQHDIYSLGVILLEIGLWTSFVHYVETGESSSTIGNSLWLGHAQVSASENKLRFEELAMTELPSRLGKRYSDIVLLCLRCLDTGNGENQDDQGFGLDVTDEDGVTIGVRYIENVLEKMQDINL